jgi:hypothetical protein
MTRLFSRPHSVAFIHEPHRAAHTEMIGAIIVGLPILLIGSAVFSLFRWVRGGRLLDPGPRSLKEMVEQNRTIIHPGED